MPELKVEDHGLDQEYGPREPCPKCNTETKCYYGETNMGWPGPPGSRLAYYQLYRCPKCDNHWDHRYDSGPLRGI